MGVAVGEPVTITIRGMQPQDLERLYELSPPEVKNPADFSVYPTIVAVASGEVVGYAQFSLGPDRVLHSQALRVVEDMKGQGIGAVLCAERVRLAKAAGATFHLYAVHPSAEPLIKILLKQGMHLCKRLPDLHLYAQDLEPGETPQAEEVST
jgi:ribosomal protein S18 acetylase RimI-like enzyme